MTDQAIEDLPRWRPRPDLDVEDLACTLEHIRRVSYTHWLGDAFDPEHMRAICMAASQALCGEPIDAPVDMNSPEWREMVRERSDEWQALCDVDLAELGETEAGAAIVARLNRAEAAAAIDDDLDEEAGAQC